MTTQHNCEGERAKLAGEVTEGDRALWESLCRLNACAANVEDYQEESVALIAKFRASVAVAEAESKVAALEVENKRLVALVESGKREGERLEWIHDNCRVVYYPPNNTYPYEHAPGAKKFMLPEIITCFADPAIDKRKAALQPAPKVV